MDRLTSYLKVEIKRIEDLVDNDYADLMSDKDYYYEQGRIEGFRYVLGRLDDINKEEEE